MTPLKNMAVVEIKQPYRKPKVSSISKALFLGIGYAANIGGTGALIGAPPNLVLQGVMNEKYPESSDINFSSWILYALPGMIVCLAVTWVILYLLFLRNRKTSFNSSGGSLTAALQVEYNRMGPIGFKEGAVIFVFITFIVVLLTQDPKFIPGWASAISKTNKIKDATPALAVTALLFILPSDPYKLISGPRLLDWKSVQHSVPWSLIILLGGSFSMAQGFKASKLSDMVRLYVAGLNTYTAQVVLIILCVITTTLTELTSNTSTSVALLDVVGDMAIAMSVHPLFFMLPVTISCSYSFMLPIATPPNAIVYEAAGMSTKDMALPGFIMNVLCCVVCVASINTIGLALFDLNHLPTWVTKLTINNTIMVPNLNSTIATRI